MSRVGKNPVTVPDGVEVAVVGRLVTAKGKLGELAFETTDDVSVALLDKQIVVKPTSGSKRARAMWGTTRSRIQNIVTGVAEGFSRELQINGVGYRAAVQGDKISLQLGFSHEVNHPIPKGITVVCAKPTSILISGADKQQVGQMAAEIRAYRPPEPYKGKGVKYIEETIIRKEGKKK